MQRWAGLACGLLVTAYAATGNAFCGFYVDEGGEELKNDATQVVLMRRGRLTVLSMQNNYEGPPQDFALVVPVPTVLTEDSVRTLPREVFDRVDRLASPRLVEYWEQNPCPQAGLGGLGTMGYGRGGGGLTSSYGVVGYGSGAGRAARPVVRVEAEFAVDEYDVAILGADESTGLERWLRAHGYHVPRGAARVLRPYVEAGSRFLVARVDADRLEFSDGRAQLSPLRIHYESDELTLPIRLGMLNADGPQDLIVHVLAPERYEVANRHNVRVPTNLRVTDSVRGQFGTFYAALFDAAVRRDPDAVVTEYAWSPTSCDPCPGPTLSARDIQTFGGDVDGETGTTAPSVPRLAIQGQFVSLSIPRSEDEETQRWVERNLRRGVRRFDRCVRGAARSGVVPAHGSFSAHLGMVTMGAADPIVELAGPVPPRMARCLRNAGRAALFGPPAVEHPSSARAQINASWLVPQPRAANPRLTLTRLHTRYRPNGRTDDLVFRAASPLVGGRGMPTAAGQLGTTQAIAPGTSLFQARYAILHPWEGAIACAAPQRGRWGGPPSGLATSSVIPAEDLGEVRDRAFALEDAVLTEVPGLDLSPPRRRRRRASADVAPALSAAPVTPSAASLMGCAVSPRGPGGAASLLGLGLLGLGLLGLSRRRRGGRRPRRSPPARPG